ncbi:LysR family transcriptional regulator [Microbacterium sp. KNMS]
MELQQMRYVVAVIEEGGFTRAAARCHVTQSALSHQIAALEREIGTRLFARTSRAVRVTEAGEAFAAHAREALLAADRAREEAASAAGEVRGTLRMGVIPTVTAVDVPAVLGRFRAEHPHVRVELRMGNSDEMVPAVRAGALDVALLGLRDGLVPEGVASRVLAREALVAVLPGGHPLASRAILSLADLADAVFADFPSGTSGREQSDHAFASAGIARDVAFEAGTADHLRGLAAAGLAVTLLPPGVVPVDDRAIAAVPVSDGPVRAEHVAWDARAPRAAARALLPLIV